jgi:hypothetical protein
MLATAIAVKIGGRRTGSTGAGRERGITGTGAGNGSGGGSNLPGPSSNGSCGFINNSLASYICTTL